MNIGYVWAMINLLFLGKISNVCLIIIFDYSSKRIVQLIWLV